MNERIKELALQAGVTGQFAAGTKFATPIPLSPEVQKFAELIVKECMEQVWYSREDGINGNISQVIKDRIKQHFGA